MSAGPVAADAAVTTEPFGEGAALRGRVDDRDLCPRIRGDRDRRQADEPGAVHENPHPLQRPPRSPPVDGRPGRRSRARCRGENGSRQRLRHPNDGRSSAQMCVGGESSGELPARSDPFVAVLLHGAALLHESGPCIGRTCRRTLRDRPDNAVADAQFRPVGCLHTVLTERDDPADALVPEHQWCRRRAVPGDSVHIRTAHRRQLDRDQGISVSECDTGHGDRLVHFLSGADPDLRGRCRSQIDVMPLFMRRKHTHVTTPVPVRRNRRRSDRAQ